MLKKIYHKVKKRYIRYRTQKKYWHEWNQRIDDVKASADNAAIPRIAEAGEIKEDYQIMHNGLKIIKDSYYGRGITQMLLQNKGVHEPQEEKVFQEVLKIMPKNAVMIELGSYWAFYSMWFLHSCKEGEAYLFEPDQQHLAYGRKNFKINHLQGNFTQAFIGKKYQATEPPTYSIDHIFLEKELKFIDILHCDIQGHELAMLEGAQQVLSTKNIGYLFISTHSEQLHHDCLNLLAKHQYELVCECNLKQTYAVDGLIVAKSKNYKDIGKITISKKK